MEEKSGKRAPKNTARLTPDDALGVVMDALLVGTNDALEFQEAQGQRELVNSTTLPTDMGRVSKYNAKAILEAAGVKFGSVVKGDPMFQYVELPAGWKKVPTDHSMWSNLVDDKGRVRAAIFYKAAFYDRSAHMRLDTRYGVAFDYNRSEKEGVGVSNVTDCGQVIFSTEPIPTNKERSWETSEVTNQLAVEWLDAHYPDWRNPGAYWD